MGDVIPNPVIPAYAGMTGSPASRQCVSCHLVCWIPASAGTTGWHWRYIS